MKLMKKLSKGIIAVVLCVLLVTTVWAANEINVAYAATLKDAVVCVNELAETVELTVKASHAVDMDAFTAQVKVPEGWKITGIANDTLDFDENNYNVENGMILWYSSTAENVSNDLLATVTVEIPANAPAGDYEIVFKLIDISRDWGMPWEDGEILTATVTVVDHADGDDSDHLCDSGCGEIADDGCHGGTATCQTPATCVECGQTYGDVNMNHHTGEVVYTNNGDTHSASYDGCGDDYVTNEAHDFTNGNCVCGAEKPEEPIAGMKGDLDMDNDVDSDDLTLLARHVAGIEKLTDPQALKNADVDGNEVIDSDDLTIHARYVAGIITDWNEE